LLTITYDPYRRSEIKGVLKGILVVKLLVGVWGKKVLDGHHQWGSVFSGAGQS